MKNVTMQNFVLGMVTATACLSLLAIVMSPYFGVEMPGEIKTFVFGLITLAIGGGAGAGLWQAAEKRGEIRGEVSASNALMAQSLGVKMGERK